jgi:GH24 family phage-related lysozyme (muramidase)
MSGLRGTEDRRIDERATSWRISGPVVRARTGIGAVAHAAAADFQASLAPLAAPAPPAQAPAPRQPFDRVGAAQLLENYEGRRHRVYLDTEGHPTIGIGFNLDRGDARARLTAVGANYDLIRTGRADLTNAQIEVLLKDDLDRAIAGARRLAPTFDQLVPARQFVLVDMVFNMGAANVRGFTRMLAQVAARNWPDAANEIRASRWHTQVGRRAVEDEQRMSTGTW